MHIHVYITYWSAVAGFGVELAVLSLVGRGPSCLRSVHLVPFNQSQIASIVGTTSTAISEPVCTDDPRITLKQVSCRRESDQEVG